MKHTNYIGKGFLLASTGLYLIISRCAVNKLLKHEPINPDIFFQDFLKYQHSGSEGGYAWGTWKWRYFDGLEIPIGNDLKFDAIDGLINYEKKAVIVDVSPSGWNFSFANHHTQILDGVDGNHADGKFDGIDRRKVEKPPKIYPTDPNKVVYFELVDRNDMTITEADSIQNIYEACLKEFKKYLEENF